jgi:hypothetical protein
MPNLKCPQQDLILPTEKWGSEKLVYVQRWIKQRNSKTNKDEWVKGDPIPIVLDAVE